MAVSATRIAKRYLGGGLYGIARSIKHGVMFRSQGRPTLSEDLEQKLCDHFIPQVELLETLLQRELSHWKVPKRSMPSSASVKTP